MTENSSNGDLLYTTRHNSADSVPTPLRWLQSPEVCRMPIYRRGLVWVRNRPSCDEWLLGVFGVVLCCLAAGVLPSSRCLALHRCLWLLGRLQISQSFEFYWRFVLLHGGWGIDFPYFELHRRFPCCIVGGGVDFPYLELYRRFSLLHGGWGIDFSCLELYRSLSGERGLPLLWIVLTIVNWEVEGEYQMAGKEWFVRSTAVKVKDNSVFSTRPA